MNVKQKVLSVFLAIVLSAFAIFPSFKNNISAKEYPRELFKVYLEGKQIGTISSKDKLYKYINEDQRELMEKLKVKEVHLPKNLNIEEYIGYEDNLIDEKKLYEEIKEKSPFTIKGSVITVKRSKEDGTFDVIKINVLKEEDYTKAVENTIKTFVSENEYNVFFDGNTYTNFEMGSTIEDIYVEEESQGNVTIKRDTYIPSDELIFTDSKTLTHYLLFGTLEKQSKYVVKKGDTIETVAFNNKLGAKEFLIINPEFTSETNLLYEGQEVNIGQLDPIVTVIKEEQKIENQVIKYKTDIKYDSTKPYGYFLVQQEGIDGLSRVTKKIQYRNSVIGAAIMDENPEILQASQNRIEIRGARISNDPIIVADAGNWAWPTIQPYTLTSYFGWRTLFGAREFHTGIDIITGPAYGTPVYAANDGNVVEAVGGGYNGSRGTYIIINHNNGYYTSYYHLSSINVTVGQAVEKGSQIGKIGNTGRSTGPHLHFTVSKDGKPTDNNVFNPLTLYR